jgi:hypothetical protein
MFANYRDIRDWLVPVPFTTERPVELNAAEAFTYAPPPPSVRPGPEEFLV